MSLQNTILLVDDNKSFREGLSISLKDEGYSIQEAESGTSALEILKNKRPDIVVADIRMPEMDGIELLKKMKELEVDSPVIIMTAHASIDVAVEAMRQGAFDFIEKPFRAKDLELKIKKGLEKLSLLKEVKRLSRENEYLKMEAKSRYNTDEIIGNSEKMQVVYALLEKVSSSNSNVLILGESGTGKELAARAIHYKSSRSTKPFIKINCSVYPEGLLESELFGHEKGSFSGALKSRIGRFEMADGGTIFIDEIGDVTPQVQIKLLRVLQEKEFERIGDNKTRHVDVRIIAATNKNIEELIKKGEFREDLYYRLNVISIHLPPLRERREDIPLLVNHFIEKCQGENGPARKNKIISISPEALEELKKYSWPGNIRELENVIERAIVMAEGSVIEIHDLPLGIKLSSLTAPPYSKTDDSSLTDAIEGYEKELIGKAFSSCNGGISKTADVLGVERNALRYKLKKYGFIMLFIAALTFLFPVKVLYAGNVDIKNKLDILWSKISEAKVNIGNIEKTQIGIENKSVAISENIEIIKRNSPGIKFTAGSKLDPLLNEINSLSKEYSSLQKRKSTVRKNIISYAHEFQSLGNIRLKELTVEFENLENLEDPNIRKKTLIEILTLEKQISETGSLIADKVAKKDSEDINISIKMSDDENDIDEITEDLEYLDDNINVLLKSLQNLHNELDYLYTAKDAKIRMLGIIKKLQAGDRFSPTESINASNIQNDIDEIDMHINGIKKSISGYEHQLAELKTISIKLNSRITNLTGPKTETHSESDFTNNPHNKQNVR
ncbi:MAG: sigma 54-interacting transcriptional regulator [Candidatus Schekmanbacteria bacterium]|nr:sigma 54-interacting transcriptional regulator [Candidatus Schekmanbacteria bacterium]